MQSPCISAGGRSPNFEAQFRHTVDVLRTRDPENRDLRPRLRVGSICLGHRRAASKLSKAQKIARSVRRVPAASTYKRPSYAQIAACDQVFGLYRTLINWISLDPVRGTRLWSNCISRNLGFVICTSYAPLTKPRFREIQIDHTRVNRTGSSEI